MTKQSASKKSKPSTEQPVVEQQKPSAKRKKMGNEIDEIFAAKRKRPAKEEIANVNRKLSKASGADSKLREKMMQEKGRRSKSSSIDNPFADSSSRSRRKTADGLTIYSEEELGVGKADAGGTRLCPFDCDCCF